MRGKRISYSHDELAWVKACSDMPRAELHGLFVQVWNRPDVSFDHIKSLCSRNGWSAGPEGRSRKKGKSKIFSAAEMDWLRANASLPSLGAAFRAAFSRDDVTDAQIVSWRKNNKVKTGRDARFPKGNVPWTKGRKLPVNPASAATQFKAGGKPFNAKPIGYESLNQDGYVLICVARPNPFRPEHPTHMAFKHKELWEAKNGPVPKGMALKCLDGNKLNCAPDNWEAVPKGMLPRLNGVYGRGYEAAPAELKPLIMATAKLAHKASEIRKGKANG